MWVRGKSVVVLLILFLTVVQSAVQFPCGYTTPSTTSSVDFTSLALRNDSYRVGQSNVVLNVCYPTVPPCHGSSTAAVCANGQIAGNLPATIQPSGVDSYSLMYSGGQQIIFVCNASAGAGVPRMTSAGHFTWQTIYACSAGSCGVMTADGPVNLSPLSSTPERPAVAVTPSAYSDVSDGSYRFSVCGVLDSCGSSDGTTGVCYTPTDGSPEKLLGVSPVLTAIQPGLVWMTYFDPVTLVPSVRLSFQCKPQTGRGSPVIEGMNGDLLEVMWESQFACPYAEVPQPSEIRTALLAAILCIFAALLIGLAVHWLVKQHRAHNALALQERQRGEVTPPFFVGKVLCVRSESGIRTTLAQLFGAPRQFRWRVPLVMDMVLDRTGSRALNVIIVLVFVTQSLQIAFNNQFVNGGEVTYRDIAGWGFFLCVALFPVAVCNSYGDVPFAAAVGVLASLELTLESAAQIPVYTQRIGSLSNEPGVLSVVALLAQIAMTIGFLIMFAAALLGRVVIGQPQLRQHIQETHVHMLLDGGYAKEAKRFQALEKAQKLAATESRRARTSRQQFMAQLRTSARSICTWPTDHHAAFKTWRSLIFPQRLWIAFVCSAVIVAMSAYYFWQMPVFDALLDGVALLSAGAALLDGRQPVAPVLASDLVIYQLKLCAVLLLMVAFCVQWILIFRGYARQMFLLRQGKYEHHDKRVDQVYNSVEYIGLQASAFVIFSAWFFLTFSVIAVWIWLMQNSVNFHESFMTWAAPKFAFFVAFTLGVKTLNFVYFRFLCAAWDGRSWQRLRLQAIGDYLNIFLYLIAAVTQSLVRLVYATSFSLITFPLLYLSVTSARFSRMDSSHAAFQSMLMVDHATNNCVLNVFVRCLWSRIAEQRMAQERKLRTDLLPRYHESVQDDDTHMVYTNAAKRQPSDESHGADMRVPTHCVSRRALNRWHLAYTLLKNPQLMALRHRYAAAFGTDRTSSCPMT